MAEPKYSVSEITTFHQTFGADLATYREAGADGVGIRESKLPEGGGAETLADDPGVVAVGDKADVLRLGLVGDAQP